jgi:hypothetical protein
MGRETQHTDFKMKSVYAVLEREGMGNEGNLAGRREKTRERPGAARNRVQQAEG